MLEEGNEQYKCSTFDLLRALLLQLLETKVGNSAIHQRLAATFGRSVQAIASKDSESVLWQDFSVILANLGDALLVIDGLDELEGGEEAAQGLLQRIAGICNHSGIEPKKFKCILTTRPAKFDSAGETFLIESHHTTSDIANFVDTKLDELAATNSSPFNRAELPDRLKIASMIKQGASGMILWAKLVLEEMTRKKTLPQMLKCLEDAPNELTKLYKKLYDGLEPTNPDTKTVLHWLLCSQRPLSLAEIEAILEIDVGENTACKRLTPVLLDIQDACGPLVEVSSQKPHSVQLVHYSVRQWLLQDDSQDFSLRESHLQAFRTSAIYLYVLFSEDPRPFIEDKPVLVPTEGQKQQLTDLCHKHALLEYAISFWGIHLQRSIGSEPGGALEGPKRTGEACYVLLTNTQNLAVMEAILWSRHGSYNNIVKLHQYAFEIRSACLDSEDSESIQNTANLAAVYEQLQDYTKASSMYSQAWVACQACFGYQEPITFDFANAFALSLEKQEKGMEAEQIYSWMWESLRKRLGDDHEETLTVAGRLAWMYQRHKRFEEANDTYCKIWETWVRKCGHLNEQTVLAAGYYARALQLTGQNERAIEVHQPRLKVANEQLKKIDPGYLAAAVAVAQAYEFAALLDQAENTMRDVLKDLDRSIASPAKDTALILMYVELVRFLERQSRSVEAQTALKQQLSWCEAKLNPTTPIAEGMLECLTDLALELQNHKLYSEASRLISWFHEYHKTFKGERSEAALNTVYWSAQVALELSTHDRELELLEAAYASSSKGGMYDDLTLESARRLAMSLHRRSDWEALERLSRKILEHIWPTILTAGPQKLPEQYGQEAVLVARRLALAYEKQDLLLRSRWAYNARTSLPLGRAEQIYFNIYDSYKASNGLKYRNTLGAMAELGKFYESRRKFDDAEKMYQLVLDTSRGVLGLSHSSTIRSVLKLAKFYERADCWSKSEKLQEDALQQVRLDWGSEYPSALEIELNLDKIRRKLGKAEPNGIKGRLPIRSQSRSVTGQQPSQEPVSENDGREELFAEQLKESKGTSLSPEELTRIQRLYPGRAGHLNRTSLKAALRIGDLLQRYQLNFAATHWYEHIVSENENSSVSPVVLYEPVRRLAHLYETAGQIEEAEKMYRRNWQDIKEKPGGNPADESSLRAFRDLFRFFQRTDLGHQQALTLLQVAWEEIKAKKTHTDGHHKAVGAIINSYFLLENADAALEVCREAVLFSPNGKLEDQSWELVMRTCEKQRQKPRVLAMQLQLDHQVSLAMDSAPTIVAIAKEIESFRFEEGNGDESLKSLRKAYEFWKLQDPVSNVTCSLGDILLEYLKARKCSSEQQALLEERWKICKDSLGYLDEATRKAGKALGRDNIILEIWNARKETHDNDNASIVAVGEDLAKHCDMRYTSKITLQLYDELFNICWSDDKYGPVHDKTIEFGLSLARQPEYKNGEELHKKLFERLAAAKDLPPALALTKYKKLALSCSIQNRYGDPSMDGTSQKILLKTVRLSKELDGYYVRSTLDILDRYKVCCEHSSLPKDKEDLLSTYEEFYQHRSHPLAWTESKASAIGRVLAGLYFTSGREILALETISEIVRHDEREYGPIDGNTVASYNVKSDFHFERKNYKAALAIHENILRNFSQGWSGRVDFMEMLHQFHMKGRALQRLGRWTEARGLYDEAFQMSSRLYGPSGFYKHKLDNIRQWSVDFAT